MGDYLPLLIIACQPPGKAYMVPIRTGKQSVLALLARLAIIGKLRFLTKLKLVFALQFNIHFHQQLLLKYSVSVFLNYTAFSAILVLAISIG